jgi:glycosyltransferase involved in cell wall biosynthesis
MIIENRDEYSPLVSCIMPTADRHKYVPHAIRYFLRQDYSNKELVIIDDGNESVNDLIPVDPSIRYFRLKNKQSVGIKRNLACEAARGDIIAHWDDDDWMSPRRLSYQIEALLQSNGEVCGLQRMLFYQMFTGNTWFYSFSSPLSRLMAGGSLVYTRDFWRASPFQPISLGEDTRFIWGRPIEQAVYLSDFSIYVAIVHSNNTSSHSFRSPSWLRWPGDLAGIMGEDLGFYPPVQRRYNHRRSSQH